MSILFSTGATTAELSDDDLRMGLFSAVEALGPRRKVLAVPPDITRLHSRAGELTRHARQYYGHRLADVLPATGTHSLMTPEEIRAMFGDLPLELFRTHDWRAGYVTLGETPAAYVREQSGGLADFSWPAQVDKLLVEGGFDLILSIGQVVPHEVSGMANYNKNILVGTGGAEGIHKSHFLSAIYGMERIMGRVDNPVRRVMDYATEHYTRQLPVIYVLTVLAAESHGKPAVRGLFIGDDRECFEQAAELSREVNIQTLDHAPRKVVVFLDPIEYKSTWLGNKAIYRTRMAIADGGELIVLAPGVGRLGEDQEIDRLIRNHGYAGTHRVLEAVESCPDLAGNLGAAAHLIHGSSEGRFSITYCPGHLSREEIEGVNFRYADWNEMRKRYDSSKLANGFNIVDGEEIFFVDNPSLGLWARYQV